jgi:predicted transcriptional regulator
MTIMTLRIPDDVKEAFDKAFEGEDKAAVITEIIRQALEKRSEHAAKLEHGEKPNFVERFRKLRESMPPISQDEIREIRNELRK